MSRRLVLFGLLAAAQLSSGCWCVRERIAWRWHNRPGIGCAPACGPVCNATPAFRIPSPVVGMPVSAGPVGAPGCSTCTTGIDPASAGYAVPIAGPGIGAPPIIGPAMPLGAPRVEGPMPPTAGVPKN